jgi:hypothetical protein
MEESSQNENIMNNNDEIYLNDVIMKEEFGIQPSLQFKKSTNVVKRKKNEKKIEKIAFPKEKVEG